MYRFWCFSCMTIRAMPICLLWVQLAIVFGNPWSCLSGGRSQTLSDDHRRGELWSSKRAAERYSKKMKSCKNTIGFINGPIGVMFFFFKYFCCNTARYLYVLRISELISLILAVGWAPVANWGSARRRKKSWGSWTWKTWKAWAPDLQRLKGQRPMKNPPWDPKVVTTEKC